MDLIDRVRELLPRAVEKRMFGGTGFMVDGALACSVGPRGLLVRVDRAEQERLVEAAGVESMGMGCRTSRGWVRVDPAVVGDDESLRAWLARGVTAARAATH